jgi:tetratricopeptide (TPR) repeat protein
MIRFSIFLILTATAAWAVPQASRKAELQRLARLPKVEFAPPLRFDRRSGFVIFPDAATATVAAANLLKDSKAVPSEAPKYLAAARVLESHGDFGTALKCYARAADLFRKRVDLEPNGANDLAGLAEALISIGRAAEAQVHLDKALSIDPEKPAILAAAARVYQERAWQVVAGDQRLFTTAGFLDSIAELLKDPPEPERIAESRRYFRLASAAIDQAVAGENPEASDFQQRSTLLSFRGAMDEMFRQAQSSESKILEIRRRLFNRPALRALQLAADRETENPALLATAIFATVFGDIYTNGDSENLLLHPAWPRLGREMQERLRDYCGRLEMMADSGSAMAAAAAEYLGCVQLHVLRDFDGSQRSFRQAVRREARRHRSWELLVFATFMSGDPGVLLETCQSRFDSLPDARGSVLLAKAYERNSDATRAELISVAALAAHPNDFLLNLTLAALLLKRENAEDFLWRIPELLRRAEKQMTAAPTTQGLLDFSLTKSIYLGLSNKPEEARAALRLFTTRSVIPAEVREVLRVLDR